MTLRELLLSVDSEEYCNVPLYQTLLKVKPEYGSNTRIAVRLKDGELTVSNTHVGSIGDIVVYPIDVDPGLQVTKVYYFCLSSISLQTSDIIQSQPLSSLFSI